MEDAVDVEDFWRSKMMEEMLLPMGVTFYNIIESDKFDCLEGASSLERY